MLGKLSWKNEPHRSLDLAGGHGRLLVVSGQLGGLRCNLVKDVIDEAVKNGHGLGADSCVGVHLRDIVQVSLQEHN